MGTSQTIRFLTLANKNIPYLRGRQRIDSPLPNLLQELGGTHDPNAFVFLQIQEMPVPGNEITGLGFQGASQDFVVRRIFFDNGGNTPRVNYSRDGFNLSQNGVNDRYGKSKFLALQNRLNLIEDSAADHHPQPAGDGEVEDIPGSAAKDDRRNQNIGIQNGLKSLRRPFSHGAS